jgi:glucose 1-dehydrogenase
MGLKGRVAVVTGSATGIGQGIAIALAQAEAKVTVTYHRDGADETMAQIKAAGGEAILVKTDVRSRESIRNLCDETYRHFGKIDIWVNNAALQFNKGLFEYSDEEFDMLLEVNLKGYWRAIQEVVPYMKKNNYGRIINVASIHAKRPTGFDPVYGTAKGGIKMLTREAALALGRYGITVNTLSPGSVKVALSAAKPAFILQKQKEEPEFYNYPESGYLSGRIGMPVDIGYIAAFLADERSSFITGSDLRADGGAQMY